MISQAEFQQIINSVTGTNYSSCRVRLGLTLLFISGVKISSLLEFSIKKYELLLNDKKTFVFTNKNKNSIQQVFLDDIACELLQERSQDFLVLKRNKETNDPIFTSSVNLKKSVNRVIFSKEING